MKKLALIAAVVTSICLPMSVSAQSVNGQFNVSVRFTPVCTVTSATPDIQFTYTAFGASQTSASTSIALQCSRGFGASSVAAFDTANPAEGLIGTSNLRYTLSTITKTAGTPGNAAAVGSNGTADTPSFAFTATLPQQAGSNVSSAGTAVSVTRNLVVTF